MLTPTPGHPRASRGANVVTLATRPPKMNTADDIRDEGQSHRRTLQYAIDESNGAPVVRVVDDDSMEVIRQISNALSLQLSEEVS